MSVLIYGSIIVLWEEFYKSESTECLMDAASHFLQSYGSPMAL